MLMASYKGSDWVEEVCLEGTAPMLVASSY